MANEKQRIIRALKHYHDCLYTPGEYTHSICGKAALMLEQSVEVVRCKDCVHAQEEKGQGYYWCNGSTVSGDYFCADGRRKERQ